MSARSVTVVSPSQTPKVTEWMSLVILDVRRRSVRGKVVVEGFAVAEVDLVGAG